MMRLQHSPISGWTMSILAHRASTLSARSQILLLPPRILILFQRLLYPLPGGRAALTINGELMIFQATSSFTDRYRANPMTMTQTAPQAPPLIISREPARQH